jgi:hypothetical protein
MMKTTLAIATLLGVLTLATSAAGTSLAELSGTMGTSEALSGGAANGASTAHAAMETALRNLPKPTNGLGIADAPSSSPSLHGSGKSGWVAAGSSASGKSSWSAARGGSRTGSTGGWVTASSSQRGSTSGGWVQRAAASQSGGGSSWARAGDNTVRRR